MNASKLVKFLEDKNYSRALIEAKRLTTLHEATIQFTLVSVFCYFQLNKHKQLNNYLHTCTADFASHPLIKTLKSTNSAEDPHELNEFVTSYVHFLKTDLSTMNVEEIDKLLFNITIKPTIQ